MPRPSWFSLLAVAALASCSEPTGVQQPARSPDGPETAAAPVTVEGGGMLLTVINPRPGSLITGSILYPGATVTSVNPVARVYGVLAGNEVNFTFSHRQGAWRGKVPIFQFYSGSTVLYVTVVDSTGVSLTAAVPFYYAPKVVPGRLVLVSGGSQTDTVAQTLPSPVVVRFETPSGVPVPGIAVRWAPVVQWREGLGVGSTAPEYSLTDSAGLASTRWTLGEVAGQQSLSVQSGFASSLVVVATALADSAEKLNTVNFVARRTGEGWGVSAAGMDRFGNPTP